MDVRTVESLHGEIAAVAGALSNLGNTVTANSILLATIGAHMENVRERLTRLETEPRSCGPLNGNTWKVWALIVAAFAGGGGAVVEVLKTVVK